ncbi:hypothetical protein AALC17_06595 [Oscillospiraceae bacterium 38-13]
MDTELRVPLSRLETSDEDLYQDAVYQGRPFTGTAWGDDGGERFEIPYVDGRAHGRCVWRFKNGKPSLDERAEGGVVVESTAWWPPGDVVRCRYDGSVRRYYLQDGSLTLERGPDWEREYYPTGVLRNERHTEPGGSLRGSWYGEDGVWAVRWRQGPPEPGRRVRPAPETEYHDAYLLSHYLKLLEHSDFAHHFLDWLFQRMEPGPKSWFQRWKQEPRTLSPEGRAMVCAMIEYDDLRVKYRGVTMAGQYRVEEARPALKRALLVNKTPPGEYHATGGGHSYGWTVAQAAARALARLDGRN